MRSRITAFILAAGIALSAGTFPITAPTAAAADSYEKIPTSVMEELPTTFQEAQEFERKYGTVSLLTGHVVYCGQESSGTPERIQMEQSGSMSLREIGSFTLSGSDAPGSPYYTVRVYSCDTWGAAEVSWYKVSRVDDSVIDQDIKKYWFQATESLMIYETNEKVYQQMIAEEDTVQYDINGDTVTFMNRSHSYGMEMVVAAHGEYDATKSGNTYSFTPKDNEPYVVTIAQIHFCRFEDELMDKSYSYPVIFNMIVTKDKNGVTVTEEGSYDCFSEDELNDVRTGVTHNLVQRSFIRDPNYYGFINSVILNSTYMVDFWANDKAMSLFCLRGGDPLSEEEQCSASSDDFAENLGYITVPTSNTGDLSAPGFQTIRLHRFLARDDNDGNGYVTYNGEKIPLTIKDHRFHYRDVSLTEDDLPESLRRLLPRTLSQFRAFREEYGEVLLQDGFVIYCDDVNFSTGDDIIVDQQGEGRLIPVMEYTVPDDVDMDGGSAHLVIVYQAEEPGKLQVTWSQGRKWEQGAPIEERAQRFYEISEDMTIREITAAEYGIPGDANGDGSFTVADLVLFSKWLLGEENDLPRPENVDFCADGKLDVYDLCGMRSSICVIPTYDAEQFLK